MKILKDVDKMGKIRDWRGKKMSSLELANVYQNIAESVKDEYEERGVHKRYKMVTRKIKNEKGLITGEITAEESMGLYDRNGKRVVNYETRSRNMRFCGSDLEFAEVQGRLKLIKANFCRVTLCPMCQWRKSMRVFFEVSKIMGIIEECHDYVPVFLTLTVKNCGVAELKKTLDNIFGGWDRLVRSKTLNPIVKGEIKPIVKGWFRALEIEYNSEADEFHPHFHAIMLVEKGYFRSKKYKKTSDWVKLWRRVAKLDYDPICHIRRTRTNKGERKEVAEVSKYMYKNSSILQKKLSEDKKADVVKHLSGAIHGRRLYAYGGIIRETAAELKLKDLDKANLINFDDTKLNPSLIKMILRYSWNMGVSNYTLVNSENKSADK